MSIESAVEMAEGILALQKALEDQRIRKDAWIQRLEWALYTAVYVEGFDGKTQRIRGRCRFCDEWPHGDECPIKQVLDKGRP